MSRKYNIIIIHTAELDAAAALSAEASHHFITAPAGVHQVNTTPQLNPRSPTGR